ncbi:MAG TPA: MBL fold metallo-hydrolase [Candidatus Paceibacterota bacterium]|nr:MBL fold metallo-hydrolase [Candidatus Paceibacterota bacterium]
MRLKKWHYVILLIVVLAINVLIAFLIFYTPDKLRVSFLDVGQGDAILIQGPTGIDMLVDAGKDRSAVRELGKQLGPLDRTIDIVVATHPDADHIGGLPAVFAGYRVRAYLSPSIKNDTDPTYALESAVAREQGVRIVPARRGSRVELGGGAYADILFPDRDVDTIETNTGSVVLRVVYGDTSFLLTGDAPDDVESWLVTLDEGSIKSDVLKAGHHGSRTSTSAAFLAAVDPSIVVISAGKDNSYGHPHQEVVERILASGAILVSTIEKGTIVFESDGETVMER